MSESKDSTREQWMVTDRAWPHAGVSATKGLFIDGVLTSAYYQTREGRYCVNVHEGGNYRITRQIVVADEETAVSMCRVVAGLPATPTPTPQWALDALGEQP